MAEEGSGPAWVLEPFEADDGTVPYERFIGKLSDFKFAALDAAMARVLAVRGLDLVRTEWLKALGEGLHEFRVRHDADEITHMFGGEVSAETRASEAVLLRVFVHFHGPKVILLIGGYDKGGDPSERRQQREIREARQFLTQFKERQRRERGRAKRGRG